jgi:hypothetical protein
MDRGIARGISGLSLALFGVLAFAGCGSSSSSSSTGAPATTLSLTAVKLFPRGRHEVVASRLAGLTGLSLPAKLQSLASTLGQFWTLEFRGAQVQLTEPTVNIIQDTASSCDATSVTTTDPPVYCAAAQTVELPVQYLQTNVAPDGDAALALVVSDVYGYHIENVLGALSDPDLTPTQLAVMDSCFSGTYFYYLEAENLLQPGDENAVNQVLASIPRVSGGPQIPPNAATADQLTAAFNQGILSQGNAAVCLPGSSTTSTTTTG